MLCFEDEDVQIVMDDGYTQIVFLRDNIHQYGNTGVQEKKDLGIRDRCKWVLCDIVYEKIYA